MEQRPRYRAAMVRLRNTAARPAVDPTKENGPHLCRGETRSFHWGPLSAYARSRGELSILFRRDSRAFARSIKVGIRTGFLNCTERSLLLFPPGTTANLGPASDWSVFTPGSCLRASMTPSKRESSKSFSSRSLSDMSRLSCFAISLIVLVRRGITSDRSASLN